MLFPPVMGDYTDNIKMCFVLTYGNTYLCIYDNKLWHAVGCKIHVCFIAYHVPFSSLEIHCKIIYMIVVINCNLVFFLDIVH